MKISTIQFLSVLIAALLARIYLLDDNLWYDELASWQFSLHDFGQLWSRWILFEFNPPAFYSILSLIHQFWGDNITAYKAVPVFFGIASVYLVMAICQRLATIRAALFAGLFMAALPSQIHFSLELRAYTMTEAAALLALLAYASLDKAYARQTPLQIGLFSIAAALPLYCHTTMILFTVALMLALAAREHFGFGLTRDFIYKYLVSGVIILIIDSWWIYATWYQLAHKTGGATWGQQLSLRSLAAIAFEIYAITPAIGASQNLVYSAAAGLFAVGAIVVLIRLIRTRGSKTAIFFLIPVMFIALVVALSLKTPIASARVFFWTSATFCVALGMGIDRFTAPAKRFGLVAGGLFCLCVLDFWQAKQPAVERYDQAAAAIMSGRLARDAGFRQGALTAGIPVVADTEFVGVGLMRYAIAARNPVWFCRDGHFSASTIPLTDIGDPRAGQAVTRAHAFYYVRRAKPGPRAICRGDLGTIAAPHAHSAFSRLFGSQLVVDTITVD